MELERIDNYYRKIEICEKAEALKDHDDLQFAIASVKKLFQEWKSIGPVPRERSEDIWERFRVAQDVLFEKRRLKFQELDKQRKENLEIKIKRVG